MNVLESSFLVSPSFQNCFRSFESFKYSRMVSLGLRCKPYLSHFGTSSQKRTLQSLYFEWPYITADTVLKHTSVLSSQIFILFWEDRNKRINIFDVKRLSLCSKHPLNAFHPALKMRFRMLWDTKCKFFIFHCLSFWVVLDVRSANTKITFSIDLSSFSNCASAKF